MTSINLSFHNNPEPMSPMISIPLDIPDVQVLNVEINNNGEFIITIESTLEGAKCHCCGREITDFHGHDDWVSVRHLSILGRPTYLRFRPKRYRCGPCSRRKKKKVTTTQQLSWHTFQSRHTRAYEEHVLLQLVNSTIKDVSIKEGLGYESVVGIVDRCIAAKVDWEQFHWLDVLGLDEIALKKGHRDYVVIITARLRNGQVKVLTVLPNRKKKTVKKFLRSIPQRLQETIHTVCVDMYQHYIDAVKEVWGNEVRIVVDRYHVAKKYQDCADKLRKKELKRLRETLPEKEYKQLKGALNVFCRFQFWEPAELRQRVWSRMTEAMVYAIVAFLSGKVLPSPVLPDDKDMGRWFFYNSLYPTHPQLGTRFRLRQPIIGIGAPASVFLQDVADTLHTDLVLPEHHQVANAVGAIAGSVMVTEEILV